MARPLRPTAGDEIYHVINRGNCGMRVFRKPGDFAAFIKLFEQARQRVDMRVLGYCLMGNHWHLVVWPRKDRDLSRFMQWLTTTHVRRWREHRRSARQGHLYQGRFKSFPVQDDLHLLTVLRYIEANPLRAGMVKRAEAWPWSSLGGAAGADGLRVRLEPWPVDKPARWREVVNDTLPKAESDRVRACLQRNRPYGDADWVRRTAGRLGLESSLRDPWRPAGKPRKTGASRKVD